MAAESLQCAACSGCHDTVHRASTHSIKGSFQQALPHLTQPSSSCKFHQKTQISSPESLSPPTHLFVDLRKVARERGTAIRAHHLEEVMRFIARATHPIKRDCIVPTALTFALALAVAETRELRPAPVSSSGDQTGKNPGLEDAPADPARAPPSCILPEAPPAVAAWCPLRRARCRCLRSRLFPVRSGATSTPVTTGSSFVSSQSNTARIARRLPAFGSTRYKSKIAFSTCPSAKPPASSSSL